MATPAASTAGQARPGQEDDAERLGRRDLLVLRLELLRRRRAAAGPAAAGGSGKRGSAQRTADKTR